MSQTANWPAVEEKTKEGTDLAVANASVYRHLLQLMLLLAILLRLLAMPSFIDSGDGIYFVRGVRQYATYNLSPHWPGYPIYIWIGKLFHLLIPDPVLALHLVAALASSFIMWPLALLTTGICRELGSTKRHGELAGLGAALLWLLFPLSWQAGAQINSDALALLLALTLLWLCSKSLKDTEHGGLWLVGAATVAGLLLGTRLSYIALLLPLAYTTWVNRGWRFGSFPGWLTLVATALAGLLTVGSWLGWQLVMEGSRFIEAGQRHLSGHYQSWGGSVLTDADWITRPVRLLRLLDEYGLGSWWPDQEINLARLPLTLLLLCLGGAGLYRLFRNAGNSPGCKLLAMWLLPYILWILVSHDLNIARYCLPLVAALCISLGLGLSRIRRFSQEVAWITLVFNLALVSVPLALAYRNNPPPGERLAAYLNAQPEPERTALVMVGNSLPAEFLAYFVSERAPKIKQVWTTQAGIDDHVQALESQGYKVYTTQPPHTSLPGKTENWTLTARLIQPRYVDSLTDLTSGNELWVFRCSS